MIQRVQRAHFLQRSVRSPRKIMKGEFIALLKDINNRKLYKAFLRSQHKLLESKGLVNQFVKMDVKKFKELMNLKFTLAVHSDWPKWRRGLLDMSRDYAGIPALWQVTYERLHMLEGIRPLLWVRDWLETTMDPGLLTKSEAEVYRPMEAKLAELTAQPAPTGVRQKLRRPRRHRCRRRYST